jgi:hypothetical protein
MNRQTVSCAFVLLLIVFGIQPITRAQDATGAIRPDAAQKEVGAYHLDFSINELAEGKKINSRKYSMNLTDEGRPKELKIGTRVPIESENGKFEYLDVGTSITVQLVSWQTPLSLDVTVDISNFATPEDATRGGRPILRQIRISTRTPIVLGKSVVAGSVDDPNSNHQFQLELTVTKL